MISISTPFNEFYDYGAIAVISNFLIAGFCAEIPPGGPVRIF
jgi:hypothetical protein